MAILSLKKNARVNGDTKHERENLVPVEDALVRKPILNGNTIVILSTVENEEAKIQKASDQLPISNTLASTRNQSSGNSDSGTSGLWLLLDNFEDGTINELSVVGEFQVRANKDTREVEARSTIT